MIAKKVKRPYFVVYKDEIVSLGADAALLLAELRFLSSRFKKDDSGYFSVFGNYIKEQLGFGHTKYYHALETLIKAKKIDYISGKNQNVKSRYKIVL